MGVLESNRGLDQLGRERWLCTPDPPCVKLAEAGVPGGYGVLVSPCVIC